MSPKRIETLSKRVEKAGEALVNEIKNVTERVTSRVDQMRKRLESMGDRRHAERRHDSHRNLPVVVK